MNTTRQVNLSTDPIINSLGPFTDEEYTPEFGRTSLAQAKVLVIGAGGLGCEILKDLALSGFKDIECIDMDTIELSNLNRQFLFRLKDVGKSKAETACAFVRQRVKGVNVIAHCNKIQDFDLDFYRKFQLVVCGLDNIEARRWINKTLVEIASTYDEPIGLIDGGTEGFQGSTKVMIPTQTACFECYMKIVPEQKTYPLCTLASTPRLPEHCIEWAHVLEWPRLYPDTKFDADVPEHVQIMYGLSLKRAEEYGIEGVTKSKTLGVVKNIIPAIASTNAIISAACCNEAFKFVTCCNPLLDDSMYYNGEAGVLASSDPYKKVDDCEVCGNLPREFEIEESLTLIQFVDLVKQEFSLESPNFFTGEGDVYNTKKSDEFKEKENLLITRLLPFEMDYCKFQVVVVDPSRKSSLKLNLKLK
ncbi:unnamed protein product [Ambrosiozyma monospora]|uniref:NEDD8-activating enzyme E1 catalytic subunit n=1 Tax=Ambrosiozyma monospora TaxID=43982 RepID=A0A9W7DF25_AMBMO|nr:unnamed protein product [Ambrosiozyma monospora]